MASKTSASTHVNPTPTPEVGAIAEGSIRQRGPVEEVIAKRMKQIGKKLQRYRGYISADPATLNKDQKEALISLPALEGAYKELEDLVRDKGPVEEQELIQAAKLREATEAAKAAALAEAGASTDAFKTSLVQPLSLFLKLYALLHPARPSDHEHLTFSALSLPPRLQDEVQATDVLRVGRIYEDITLGGQAAISALEGLVNGPKGEDEENDHVHHLLQLLSQPEEATEGVTEETTEDYTAAALVTSTEEAVEAVPEAVVPEEENELVNGHASQQPTINFLQADELDTKPDQVDQEPVQSETKTETIEAVEAPLEAPSSSRAALDFAPATSSNWADLDDDDVPAQSTQTQSVPVEITPTAPIEQSTVSQIPHAESNPVEAATEAEAPKEAGNAKPPRGPRTKKPSNRGKPQNRQTSQRPAQSESGPKKDDDGFETVRRAPPPAVSGGRGRGGRGGNGASRGGRGRGGATNGTRPNGATGTGRPSNDRQSSQTGQGAAKEAKPKASIYKTVQPSGPVSAPIH